eukprot:Platyproteum_vivax@DN7370_c0_g1_i1.p1
MIMKAQAHTQVLNILELNDGMDFQFSSRQHAQTFSEFVQSCFVSRSKHSKQLISCDTQNNHYVNKHTLCVELCPVCKDDLVMMHPKVAEAYGGLPPLMLCTKVSLAIHLLDPLTRKTNEISATSYWKTPFKSLLTRQHLTEYVVLNVDSVEAETTERKKQA